MAERIDELKEAEKAKLNAAFEVEQDTLKGTQDKQLGDEGAACFGGGWWGSPGFWLVGLGLFFLLTSSGMGVSWWIVPLVIFVLCKSAWGRC
jgi:hypothetical protein